MQVLTLLFSFSLFSISTIIYVYYTLWVYIQVITILNLKPLLSNKNYYKKYFPSDRFWLWLLPLVVLLSVAFSVVFFLIVFLTKKNKIIEIKEMESKINQKEKKFN